ncbi:MAG TPA: BACON domain-containing carbohydrate-binding protein, partial [Mycobacterium sp.]|nr:BACON domain-containing carbohydrate-binding protein [Mycobacterium sp.]
MRLFLVALLWVAPVLAQNCDYTVSPSPTLTISSGASTGTISVTTSSTCSWAVVNNDPNLYWLKFDVMQGTGSGAVHYTATANPTALVRGGNIQVAGKTIGVSQGATDCTYTLDSTSQNFPTDGGAGTLKLTTGCVWQPSSANANMITIPTSGTIRTGTGTVDYTVSHNTCVYGRNSSIRFSTTSPASVVPVFSVNQDGSQSNLTLSAMSVSLGPEASDGRVSVTTGFGCTWSAFSSETWIQLINASGSGNGAITYHVQANNTAPRTGTIHVGGLNYTITQSSSGPPAPAISSVTSAANYRADAASPGEIVTIFGSNMGPATLTTLQLSGGNVSSFLAGTQVLFDGVPAPIIYTRNNQVSAVAPYGVAGKTNTQVQVVYNGQTSTGVSVPVQSSHPAIFTMDSSGLGPG